MINTRRVISIDVATNSYKENLEYAIKKAVNRESGFIAISNVHMVVEAYDSLKFREMLVKADFATADGMPLVLFNQYINKVKQERTAGMDLVPDLLSISNDKNLKVLFYGGQQSMLDVLNQKIINDFPNLDCQYFSPPFRELKSEEILEIDEMIKGFNPHIIFVCLGCPKQEKWMYNNYKKFNSLMLGVGGAVPVYAGIVERAPSWMQKLSLEWLFRLVKEPKRLFKRYFYTNTKFLWLTIRYLMSKN
jgi:N-acetylglucosaminyldiphosphoundecaprenol N-acetyl-beta-D-mannosaminyltransferase